MLQRLCVSHPLYELVTKGGTKVGRREGGGFALGEPKRGKEGNGGYLHKSRTKL